MAAAAWAQDSPAIGEVSPEPPAEVTQASAPVANTEARTRPKVSR